MVERLTEKNLELGEQISILTSTVEDLEALKELNDELEEQHADDFKALQTEIGALHDFSIEPQCQLTQTTLVDEKTALIRDQTLTFTSVQSRITDYETTIVKFRDLVKNLELELKIVHEAHSNTSEQANQLLASTQQVNSLSIQLQSTLLKHQAAAVDLEIKSMEVGARADEFELLKLYLPNEFFKLDYDCIQSYLFFKRIIFKSDLIYRITDQNATKSLESYHRSSSLVQNSELKRKSYWLSGLARICVRAVEEAHTETDDGELERWSKIWGELISIERRLDSIINSAKAKTIKVDEILTGLEKSIAQLEHVIASTPIRYSKVMTAVEILRSYGEGVDATLACFDSEFERLAGVVAPFATTADELNLRTLEQVKGKVMEIRATARYVLICGYRNKPLTSLSPGNYLGPFQITSLTMSCPSSSFSIL